MKKYSVEVVATAAIAAILIQPTLAFTQDRAPDTVAFFIEAVSGLLATNEFTLRKNALIGETLIPLFEGQSVDRDESSLRFHEASPSASTLKLQSVVANEKAIEARIQNELNTGTKPALNDTVIRVDNEALFEAGSGKLSIRGQETLGNVASIINRHASPEVRVLVNADADAVLGKKRANAIRNYLAKSSKITVDQVRIVRALEGVPADEARFTTSIQVLNRSY